MSEDNTFPETDLGTCLRKMHSLYWGQPVTEHVLDIQESGIPCEDDECNMLAPTSLFYIDVPNIQTPDLVEKIMVRGAYKETYVRISDLAESAPDMSTVVCGHPGVGTSDLYS